MATRRKARTLRPPPGLYDPALDAAESAAQRGYDDYQADILRDFGVGYSGGRAGHDYQLGREDLERGRRRGQEDHIRSVAGLQRQYQQLGRRQLEGARRAGVTSGGLAAKAAGVRAANQARDRDVLDTGFRRMNEDTDVGLGRLALGYQRQVEDARVGLTRAGRENEQFGLDTNASRVFAATQAGWDPYAGPRDAFATYRARGLAGERSALAGARRRPRRRRIGRVVGTSYGANF